MTSILSFRINLFTEEKKIPILESERAYQNVYNCSL